MPHREASCGVAAAWWHRHASAAAATASQTEKAQQLAPTQAHRQTSHMHAHMVTPAQMEIGSNDRGGEERTSNCFREFDMLLTAMPRVMRPASRVDMAWVVQISDSVRCTLSCRSSSASAAGTGASAAWKQEALLMGDDIDELPSCEAARHPH